MDKTRYIQPTNLVELALPFVDVLSAGPDIDEFAYSRQESEVLNELDSLSSQAGFDGEYHVAAGRAWAIPKSFCADSPVSLGEFFRLGFIGTFCSHAIVKMRGLHENQDIRALCLSFDDVLLLPGFDYVPEDRLVHVPVLAVDDIIPTD